jgi:hypothetical protein
MKEQSDDPVITTTPEETPKDDSAAKKLVDLEDKITVCKERGNAHFKKRSYKDAIKAFSEAYNMFTEQGSPKSAETLCTKVT